MLRPAHRPLRTRTCIRDHWDAPQSSLRKANDALSTTLGPTVTLHADFAELGPQLAPHFAAPDALVPSLASILTTYLGALNARLAREDDSSGGSDAKGSTGNGSNGHGSSDVDGDSYADRFLARCAAGPGGAAAGRLDVYLEAAGAPPPRGPTLPRLGWHPRHRGALRLEVPRAHSFAVEPAAIAAMIDALGADDAALAAAASAEEDVEGEGEPSEDDASEWADVATPSQSAASVVGGWGPPQAGCGVAPAGAGARPRADRMPRDLPEPRALFARTPPYLLQVSTERGAGPSPRMVLRVACSHQRTLELLLEYLRRHLRMDETSSRRAPVVKLRLRESVLAGPLYDALEIEGADDRSLLRNDLPVINPVLILSFVEGVLGYRYMMETGGVLTYRRDRVFE